MDENQQKIVCTLDPPSRVSAEPDASLFGMNGIQIKSQLDWGKGPFQQCAIYSPELSTYLYSSANIYDNGKA